MQSQVRALKHLHWLLQIDLQFYWPKAKIRTWRPHYGKYNPQSFLLWRYLYLIVYGFCIFLYAPSVLHFRDIQRALSCGYPIDMQHKLYERKGKCFTKLKQYQNAMTAYKDSLKKLSAANMIEEKKNAFAKGTDKLIQQLKDAILHSPSQHKSGFYFNAYRTL